MPRAARSLTTAAIAELVGGRLDGDGSLEVHAVSPLDRAHGDALSLFTGSRYAEQFSGSGAGAVLIPIGAVLPAEGPKVRIWVSDPQRAMARVVAALFPAEVAPGGVDSTARLGSGVALGRGVQVGPFCVIGDRAVLGDRVVLGPGVVLEAEVQVGDDSVLDAHAVCYQGTAIGRRVRIKAGAVLGGVGFGFVSDRAGHHPIPHVGGCVIGDDVSIGANSAVDRGSIDDTVIGAGSRLDNHVHIGHNARLGERCLVMGGSVVAGSARIGNDVILAGHTAVGGHFIVGDGARIGAKAGVISDVPAGADFSGFPARPHREFLRAQAALYRLAPIARELESLVTRPK